MTEMTHEEWKARGTELFGPDKMTWRFKCPACGHVQTPADFREHKDAGADPNLAYTSCIGRFMSECRDAFTGEGPGPCNYAGYGLLRIAPIVVTTEDGAKILAFDFDVANLEVRGEDA